MKNLNSGNAPHEKGIHAFVCIGNLPYFLILGPVWNCCVVGRIAFKIAFEIVVDRISLVSGKLIFKSIVSTKISFRVFGKLSMKSVVTVYNYQNGHSIEKNNNYNF